MRTTHRLTARLVAITAAAVTVLSLTATGAQAATTYTPTGGGPGIAFTGNSVSFKDIPAEQSFTCPQVDLAGNVVDSGVSRAYGVSAADVTSLTASGCTNPIFGPTTVTPAATWGFTITGDATGSTWPARFAGVAVNLTAAGCSIDIAGSIDGTFDEATQIFDPVSGPSGLTITALLGTICPLIGLEVGDEIEVNGTWTVSPPLDISNP